MQDGMIYILDDPAETYAIAFNMSNFTAPVDLALSPENISVSNPTPHPGETITINATVHNIGIDDASNVTVVFRDEYGTQIGPNQTIATINASGTGIVQVTWEATSGVHTISVIVDPYDEIAESNETNNEAFTTLTIGVYVYTATQANKTWIIEPVMTDKSIVDFYDYRSDSSHTGFEEPYISKIYLYKDNISGELGLIIHHNKDEEDDSGTVKMDLQNVPPGALVVVADDSASEFSLSQEPEGNWDYDENTDGCAMILPANQPWSITVIPDFINGINAWRLVNENGSEIELDMGEPLVISYTVPPPVPIGKFNRTIYIKENSGTDLIDYQVLVNLSENEFPIEANESGADLRFVDANGNVLNYWIEEFNHSAKSARIWIKVPELPANETKTLKMYWGNPNAPPMSNGDAVFEFFDDFEETSLDTRKWIDIVGVPPISNSILTLSGGSIEAVKGSRVPAKHRVKAKIKASLGFFRAMLTTTNAPTGLNPWNYNSILFQKHESDSLRISTSINRSNIWAQDVGSPDTNWHLYEFSFDELEAKFFYDGYLKGINSQHLPDQPLNVELIFEPFTGGKIMEVDWILVTKYLYPEPSVSFEPQPAVFAYSVYTDPNVTWEVMDVNTPSGIQRGNTIDILKDGKTIVRLDAGMSMIYVYNSSCSAYSYLGVFYRVCHDGPSYYPTQSDPKIEECELKCVLSVNSSSNGGAITAHYTVMIYPNGSVYVDKTAEVQNSLCTDECGIEDGNIGLTLSLVGGHPCDGNTHVKVCDNNSWYGWDPTSCSGYWNIDTTHALDSGDQFSVNRSDTTFEFFTEYTQGYNNNGEPSPLAAVVQHGPGYIITILGRKGLTMYSPTNLPAGSYMTRGWLRTYCSAENRPPIASFTYTPETSTKGQEITFNASSSYDPDGTIVDHSWDFGDGSNATGVVVNHTYTWTGLTDQRYNVTLNVTDDLGLTNTTTVSLLVAAIDSIVVEDAEAVWDLTMLDKPDVDYLVGEPGVMVTKYADTFSYFSLDNATAIGRLHGEPNVMVTKYADTFSYFSLDNATAIGRLHGEPGVMVTKYADTFMLEGLTAPPFAP
jgi:hypothetical protein